MREWWGKWDTFDGCVSANQDKDDPEAYCASIHGKGGEALRHRDFQRIYDEFTAYYKDPSKGDSEYYSWLKALNLNETRTYGEARESFQWAKDMIRYLREDDENKYYGVIVGLPLESMNGNVYKERDLVAGALSLKGKHPSLNHKPEFWFNEHSRWGTLTVEDAKYEEGAVEAILRVPKTAVCPICNGEKMTKLIDEQRIVNVSLEGECAGGQCGTGECDGFYFSDPPFTLLTSNVLPGIPLARIKPLERIMVEALHASQKQEKKRMKVKARVVEDSGTSAPPSWTLHAAQDNPPTQTPDKVTDKAIDQPRDLAKTVTGHIETQPMKSGNAAYALTGNSAASPPDRTEAEMPMECPEGQKMNPETGKCEPMEEPMEALTPSDSMPNVAHEPPSSKSHTKPDAHHTTTLSGVAYNTDGDTTMHPTEPGIMAPKEQPHSHVWSNRELLDEQVARIKAETREATAKDESEKLKETMKKVETIWSSKYMQLSADLNKEKAITANQESVIKEQRETIRKEQLRSEDLRVEVRDIKSQLGDMTSINNKQGHLVEDLKIDNANLTKKYNDALGKNLELTKALTQEKEDFLDIAQQKDSLEEKLNEVRKKAKKILRIKA